MISTIFQQLRRDENEVLHAYTDSEGYLTIGVGRLIDKRKGGGLRPEESAYLLNNDVVDRTKALTAALPWFSQLDEIRQGVLINMAFQLGTPGLLAFHNTLALIAANNYTDAADEMLKSKWATQTPERAKRLSDQMRDGNWR